MKSIPLSVLFVLASVASPARAQTVNLVGRQLDGIRTGFFDLGPFYVTPTLRFSGGYDSNALSTTVPESDYTTRMAPGVRLGVPLGSSAFVDIVQEVDFVWYREQSDLRQVFDVTRLGGGWGGRRFLFEATNEFRDDTRRPTSEFDSPVETRSNELDASLTLALGWRQELSLRYEQFRNDIKDRALGDGTVADRLSFVRDRFSADMSRKLTARTRAIFEGFYEKSSFDDVTRDSNSYGARAGFDFSPTVVSVVAAPPLAGLNGRVLLGFKNVVPLDDRRVDYTGLIGSADVSVASSGGTRLQGIFSRDVIPSIFEDNWYFVETRFGGALRFQVHERFSVEPGITRGKNNYPLPALVRGDNGELVRGEILDEQTTYRLTFAYRIHPSWSIGVTTEYLDRQSNLDVFQKNRLQVSFQMALSP